ncbi:MAG: hypothetical protein CMC99_06010, partial [Flavobacteriales bacterium]|nr:hypothetical protein [Flavobacteriales bacterium]
MTIEVSSETIAGDAAGNYTVVRTFTATDDAGNSTSATQTITVEDTTAPEFEYVSEDFIVHCSFGWEDIPEVVVFDGCGEVDVSIDLDTIDVEQSDETEIIIVYSAMDEAGNISLDTCQVTIEFLDIDGDNICDLGDDCVLQTSQITAPPGMNQSLQGQRLEVPADIRNVEISLMVCSSSDFEMSLKTLPTSSTDLSFLETQHWTEGALLASASQESQSAENVDFCNTQYFGTSFYNEVTFHFDSLALQENGRYVLEIEQGFVLNSWDGMDTPGAFVGEGEVNANIWHRLSGCTVEGLSFGCTDSTACNFLEEAEFENGGCVYSSSGFDCNGNCLLDLNANGICDPEEIVGCDDSLAVNFNPLVNVVDLESCIYDSCQMIYGVGAYTSACGWCVGGEAPQNEETCQGVCVSPTSLQHMPSGGLEFAGIQGQHVSIDSDQTLMAMRLKLCPSQTQQVNLRGAHES